MSSILLIGAANAETHVATKGYSDTHVAGAVGPKTTAEDTDKIIKTTSTDGTQYELVDMPTAYTAGTNVQISDTGVISATDTDTTYTAGTNVQISDTGVISATDTTYTAGDNIAIGTDGTISATYTAGTNVQISDTGVISATDTDTTYTAGTNVQISDTGVISATDTTYTAGTNVDITNGVISATDTTYTAGTNVQISDTGVISATDTTYTASDGLVLNGTTIKGNYTGENGITVNNAAGKIGFDTSGCPQNTRCALTTATDGSLVWEPLTTPWGDDGTADSGL